MNIVCLDDAGCLYLSPKIEDWSYLDEHGMLRQRRPGALFNERFVEYLLSHPGVRAT